MNKLKIEANTKWMNPDLIKREQEDKEVISCDKCGCKWLELVNLKQYHQFRRVVLGQDPVAYTDQSFLILKCPKCSEVYEPPLHAQGHDATSKKYQEFVKMMMEPIPGEDEEV